MNTINPSVSLPSTTAQAGAATPARTRVFDALQVRISMGWVMLLLILTVSLLVLVINGIMDNDGFSVLRADPGRGGLRLIVYLFGIYSVMPILVLGAHASGVRGLRIAVLVLTSLLFLFFVLHHLSHWQHGDRPNFNSHVLELAHHAIALWLVVTTWNWQRGEAR